MERTVLLPDEIFTGEEFRTGQAVIVAGGRIESIVPRAGCPEHYRNRRVEGLLAPAFIDVQLYGAGGKLLSVYPGTEALELLNRHCREGGTTLFLPTLATNALEVFYKSIDAVRAYWEGGGQGVYGLHLEGPWINPAKKGAHVPEYIHQPSLKEVEDLLQYGKGVVRMITLAPEICGEKIIEYIRSEGIVVSAGHSNATYKEAVAGFDRGIGTVTHLFNAMSPLQHRAPGLVGAAFLHPSVRASIIVDGHHVDFEAVAVAKRMMGPRLFVITDAVTETDRGPYRHQRAGDKYESGGILSGSAVSMHDSFVNLVEQVGVEPGEALRMCSRYPAEMLGIGSHYGRIAPGYAAQFVVLDKQLALAGVITDI